MSAIIGGPHATFTDDDLLRLSEANPGWKLERDDDGALILRPTSTPDGSKRGEAAMQLYEYAKRAGGKAFDSSSGFTTPRGGVVSPDASWISAERVTAFGEDHGFWKVTPDVVIELAGMTDWWSRLTAKIDKYVADGATYALAIDPDKRKAYQRGRCPDGLVLDIDKIIDA